MENPKKRYEEKKKDLAKRVSKSKGYMGNTLSEGGIPFGEAPKGEK